MNLVFAAVIIIVFLRDMVSVFLRDLFHFWTMVWPALHVSLQLSRSKIVAFSCLQVPSPDGRPKTSSRAFFVGNWQPLSRGTLFTASL